VIFQKSRWKSVKEPEENKMLAFLFAM